jgi:hypothetical protein
LYSQGKVIKYLTNRYGFYRKISLTISHIRETKDYFTCMKHVSSSSRLIT